jgi:hypothetical protein
MIRRRVSSIDRKKRWLGRWSRKVSFILNVFVICSWHTEPEAEDLEIGQQNDLAADVDDGAADEDSDPEGLDSSDDEELGLDMLDEESEGELL